MLKFSLNLTHFFDFFSQFEESSNWQSDNLPFNGLKSKDWEREGVVVDAIAPDKPGQIQAFGSYWTARTEANIILLPGDRVTVTERQGLVLIVELSNSSRSSRMLQRQAA
jgi:membrane-bound ClpP family serine protease